MPTESTDTKARLIDLADYVRHVVQLADKPNFALKEYKQLVYHETVLKNRVGIHHDLSDEDGPLWLKIDRLNRIDPPKVPEDIADWITVSRDPFKSLDIQSVRTETLGKPKTDQLVASGVLDSADVQPTLKPQEGVVLFDVIFRLDRLPDVKSSIEKYVNGPWLEWSETEKLRRETIAIYDDFFAVDQTIRSEGTEQPLEVVWGVGLARWRTAGHEIDHPLVEQLVEINVDPADGAIIIRPRSAEPQVALKPYLALENPGAELVLRFAKEFLTTRPEDEEFCPYVTRTFEPILRQAFTHLDPNGTYYPDHLRDSTSRSLPEVSGTLTVTDTWTLYVRRRTDNFLVADLDRLKDAIRECDELPGPTTRLVTEPSDEGGYEPALIDLNGFHPGTGGSAGGGSVSTSAPTIEDTRTHDFFFPKPFNDEQVSIIQRLGDTDGVVVQGPPGTGKTHTIANIVCHYLATSRRVLVTSKGEAALSVLREHIPKDIRDLAISLLTNERAGLKQLERAVNILANTASQIDARELELQILSGQERIIELQRRITEIEAEVRSWADKHLTRAGASERHRGTTAMDLARKIVAERDEHAWFPDQITSASTPKFGNEDVAALRESRKRVGEDLVYLRITLPSLSDLPDAPKLVAIHQDLINAHDLERQAADNSIPQLSLTGDDPIGRAKRLLDAVQGVVAFFVKTDDGPWLRQIVGAWRQEGTRSPRIRLFNEILELLEKITLHRPDMVRSAVEIPNGALKSQELIQAVNNATAGGRPFGLLPFGKSGARELFPQIHLQSHQPRSNSEWAQVAAYIAWRRDISTFVARWNRLADEYDLPPLQDEGEDTARWLAEVHQTVEMGVDVVVTHTPLIQSEIPQLFPYGLSAEAILTDPTVAQAATEAIQLNLSRLRLAASRSGVSQVLEALGRSGGPIVENLRQFLRDNVGNPALDFRAISDGWQTLSQELQRVHALKPSLDTIERGATLVAESGAPAWATALRIKPILGVDDTLTPSNWRKSWEWARMDAYLRQIDGRERLRELSAELLRRDNELKKVFGEVVRLRTYLGLKRSIRGRVAAALTMFTTAIRRIGKGTGIRARRFRRDARDAMEQCYSAVPCWIMPTWRVSESLPATLGSFDLVIVDEASQSDITALPAIVRGRKVLVVGDDKQVSPTAAFVEERKILQLKHNYLKGQPYAPLLLPGGSLYDLAQAMYPGERLLLREHFRCVEPIIRFSFQFYTEELIPLRLPKASERLDPPLIDVYVETGHKDKRQINVPEAEAIVDEIERLVTEDAYAHRRIGVVSLIGAKQAHFIQSALLERIGEEAFLRHDIACGDSATFQGKERDIMFISMVACPNTKTAQTSLQFQQRFNVALSRARDRQYLFRSVTEEVLRADDLKAKVIRHFKSPMGAEPRNIADLLELCDSDFERDVFTHLNASGFRVTPQVKVGAYSIDLVVDGVEDRRLAVELDGDKHHTPDRWADDFARQRVLERVGWRFWRCWASSFYLDPEACMADLTSTLLGLGIDPMGGERRPTFYVEHRIIGATSRPQAEEEPDSTVQEQARTLPLFADHAQKRDVEYHVPEAVSTAGTEDYPTTNQQRGTAASQEISARAASRFTEELVVEPGDRVLISYHDEPSRQYTLILSENHHDPDHFVINTSKPLAQALMGWAEHDEVDIPAGGSTRTVTILRIERPESAGSVLH